MDSDAPLQRTPIEYYMFAAVLVVLNMVVLVATGHSLLVAIPRGLFFGLFEATMLLLIVATLRLVLGRTGRSDDEPTE
ncbi:MULTISPECIES: hypothetical protein [Haloterrigena]|uniref:Uncharacterized protein n=2 Tax=Haloterrigena TaxID=121871 RepID=M0BVZ3_9EURY|nr:MULTISPECIES: hypothetical protein [Haloterrigena]ELZ14558.1 hypothetical protein C477_20504 [Haloterrigena salina JCM 13891]QRV16089.1 hypothetical protein JMJ58_04115 [Haloterrigena salifodinae]